MRWVHEHMAFMKICVDSVVSSLFVARSIYFRRYVLDIFDDIFWIYFRRYFLENIVDDIFWTLRLGFKSGEKSDKVHRSMIFFPH